MASARHAEIHDGPGSHLSSAGNQRRLAGMKLKDPASHNLVVGRRAGYKARKARWNS
jgi:hypothetical protein